MSPQPKRCSTLFTSAPCLVLGQERASVCLSLFAKAVTRRSWWGQEVYQWAKNWFSMGLEIIVTISHPNPLIGLFLTWTRNHSVQNLPILLWETGSNRRSWEQRYTRSSFVTNWKSPVLETVTHWKLQLMGPICNCITLLKWFCISHLPTHF